jgi:hypothetical protein
MNRVQRWLSPTAVLVVVLALPASAAAQATRTWVSGVGDDANPCSRTAPCKTWAGALAKTAQGGEIDALDSGGFGAVTITQSVTLSATGVTAGVLVAGTNGITINTTGDPSPGDPDRDVVTLRGLDFNGLVGSGLDGVQIVHAGSVRLEDDDIYGFANDGVEFAPSPPTEVGAPVPSLLIEDSTINDNAQDGVLALPPPGDSGRVVIEDSQIEDNGCGIAAGLSSAAPFSTASCGTAATGSGTLQVDSANTSSSNNTGAGVQSDGSTVTNELSSDLVVGNGIGLQSLSDGQIISAGANSVFGNATDGTPTSTQTTGPAGPTGPTGPASLAVGPTGGQGPAGDIELVTCKSVTVTVKKKVKGKTTKVKKTEQKCTGKLASGTVKFTSTGSIVTATLSRAGDVYATGTVRMGSTKTEGALQLHRQLTRGRYTLTLSKGHTVLTRRTVVEP